MWVEFVVGSPLCSERFFSRYFLLKNYKISKLQSNMDQADEKQQVEALSLNHCLLLLFYFNLVHTCSDHELKFFLGSSEFKSLTTANGFRSG